MSSHHPTSKADFWIQPALSPGTHAPFRLKVNSPIKPGSYILRVTLVQEFIRWFDEPPTSVMIDLAIRIC